MKRVALYVRVSTQEQKKYGLSVDNQIDALKEFCKQNKYTVAGLYNDAGISARKRYTKRPALLDLLDDCKAGKIDLIIFTKLDRWFRSVGDYYEVQRQLDQYGIPWRAIWEDYETETSSGLFKVNIMLSVAQSEADRASERVKDTMAYKKAKGDYLGNNVTGYIRINKGLQINEKHRPYVRSFFEKYMETRNITQSLIILHNAGIMVTAETAHRMLKNTVYKGIATCGHKCEPYLTEEEWNYIQGIMPVTNRKSASNSAFYFTGLLKCHECGYNLTGCSYWNKQHTRKYKYYRCKAVYNKLNCDNTKMVSEDAIESFLLSNLDVLLEDRNVTASCVNSDNSENIKKISQLEAKIKRIGDRYEEGEITKDEYKSKVNAINDELKTLRAGSVTKKPKEITLPESWKDIYNDLDDIHKRTFWNSIIDYIVIKPDNYEVYFL